MHPFPCPLAGGNEQEVLRERRNAIARRKCLRGEKDAADLGAQANARSDRLSISGDGRYVAFESGATNLIPGGGSDVNGNFLDIFVFDRNDPLDLNDGTLELVSRQAALDGGAQANVFDPTAETFDDGNQRPFISADGHFVVFESQAKNLIPGAGGDPTADVNAGDFDVFVRHVDTDKDGIANRVDGQFIAGFIDESGVSSSNFTDQDQGGTTFGSIFDPADLVMTIVDAADPTKGVLVAASGGGIGIAQVDAGPGLVCTPAASINLTDGDEFVMTCSSLTVEAQAGPVEILLENNVVVTVPTDAEARVDDLGGGLLLVTNVGDGGTITVDDGGVETLLGPEDFVADVCLETDIPESVPTVSLKPNRWALIDDNFDFDTVKKGKGKGPGRSYTTTDTAGCSCEQIIEAQGLGAGHRKHGCSISAMDDWVALVNP